MPIYDYKCTQCQREYAYFHVRSDDKNKCPYCSSEEAEKLPPKNTSFQLKGKGWAKDRYGK